MLTYDNSAGTIGLEAAAGGGSPGGSDTQVQYNNGGSFGGIAGFTFTDTSGSEQFLFSDTSDTALVKIVQEGTGAAFQVHDAGSDTSIFQVNQIGTVAIGFNTSGGGGYGKLQVAGTNYSYTHGAEAGSAGSPSFQFVGDQNTGMFSGGTDILGFSTGGTERLAIGAAGEILIGGTAAGNDGQVLTSGGSGAAVTWEDAGGSPAGSDTFIQYNNGGSFGATTLSYDDTADAEQYKIDVSSSVAPFVIVQTGTGNAFEVHDDTDPDNNRFEIDQYGRVAVQGQAGTNSAALYAGGVIASASRIRSAAGSASNLAFSTTGDTNTGMYFPAADNLGFSTGGTERFRFGSSGEILIGGSAAGTSGQVLTSGGSGAAVTWEDAASGGGGGASVMGDLTDVSMDITNFVDGFLLQTNSDGSAPTTGTLNNATGNIGIGKDVLKTITSADYNVAIGYQAGDSITTGNRNILIGEFAGEAVDTGTDNVILGARAGRAIHDRSGAIMIGRGAGENAQSSGVILSLIHI